MDLAFEGSSVGQTGVDLLGFLLKGLDVVGDLADVALEVVHYALDLSKYRNLRIDLLLQRVDILTDDKVIIQTLIFQLAQLIRYFARVRSNIQAVSRRIVLNNLVQEAIRVHHLI